MLKLPAELGCGQLVLAPIDGGSARSGHGLPICLRQESRDAHEAGHPGDRHDDAANDRRRARAALRQTEQRGLKVLYLTGFSDRLFKENVTLWEGEAFLDKPCGVQGLL